MAECARCWNDAGILAMAVGSSQLDEYQALIDERGNHTHQEN